MQTSCSCLVCQNNVISCRLPAPWLCPWSWQFVAMKGKRQESVVSAVRWERGWGAVSYKKDIKLLWMVHTSNYARSIKFPMLYEQGCYERIYFIFIKNRLNPSISQQYLNKSGEGCRMWLILLTCNAILSHVASDVFLIPRIYSSFEYEIWPIPITAQIIPIRWSLKEYRLYPNMKHYKSNCFISEICFCSYS